MCGKMRCLLPGAVSCHVRWTGPAGACSELQALCQQSLTSTQLETTYLRPTPRRYHRRANCDVVHLMCCLTHSMLHCACLVNMGIITKKRFWHCSTSYRLCYLLYTIYNSSMYTICSASLPVADILHPETDVADSQLPTTGVLSV